MVAKGLKRLFGKKSKKNNKISSEPISEHEPELEEVREDIFDYEPKLNVYNEDIDGYNYDAGECRPVPIDDDYDPTTQVTIITNEPTADETVIAGVATRQRDDLDLNEEENKEEKEEVEPNEDKLQYKRINTMHAELYIPYSANSGDVLDIEHDGCKQIKVPKGQQGQNITVKMIKQEDEQNTGAFCGCL